MKSTLAFLSLGLMTVSGQAFADKISLLDVVCGGKINTKQEVRTEVIGYYVKRDNGSGVLERVFVKTGERNVVYYNPVSATVNCIKVKSNGLTPMYVNNVTFASIKSEDDLIAKLNEIEDRLPSLRYAQQALNEVANFSAKNADCSCNGTVLNCSIEIFYKRERDRGNLTSGLNLVTAERCEAKARDIEVSFPRTGLVSSSQVESFTPSYSNSGSFRRFQE